MEPTSPYPCSEPAEKGLLASFLHSPAKTYQLCLSQGAAPSWFSEEDRSTVFSVFMDMAQAGQQIDLITATNWILDHRIKFNTPVPDCLLAELLTFTANATMVADYLGIMRKNAARKLGIIACEETARKLREECASLQDVHTATVNPFMAVHDLCTEEETEDWDHVAKMRFLDEMEAAASGTTKPDLFPTYFPTIDEEIGGGQGRGEMLLIRARKGCGKSLFGQSIIQENSLGPLARKSAIFTFEMPYNQVMRRLVARQGKVSLKAMKEGKYKKADLDNFRRATMEIMQAPIRIYDMERIKKPTPSAIFSAIRRQHKNEGLDMVMIDHLHLLSLSDKRLSEKRTDELLHDFSQQLKALTLELKLVTILLAQENTEGGTFGGTQVETDVDNSVSLVPKIQIINGIKRIIGTEKLFVDKWREGNLLGRTIPVRMEGSIASIFEDQEVVRATDNEF